MISREWDRSRRRVQNTCVLLVLAAVAAIVAVLATAGIPDVWWPRIGSAFATPDHSGASAPCGPRSQATADSCTRSPTSTVAQPSGLGAADVFRFAVPAAGVLLAYAVLSSGRRRP